jgi:hypothetical protein
VKRAADIERDRPLRAPLDRQGAGAGHRLRLAADDDLPRRIQVAHLGAGRRADGLRGVLIEPEQRGHRAGTRRGRGVREPSALFDEAKAVIELEGAGGGERGVLAETVAGDERRGGSGDARFPRGGEAGQARDVDGRLRIRGLPELFGRPLEAQMAQRPAERRVGALEQLAGGREPFVEVAAHAGLLRPLAGEHPRDGTVRHRSSRRG